MLVAALLFVQADSQPAVEARLRKELVAVAGVKFSHDGDTLVVKYRTETVMVPKRTKSAQVITEKEKVERPSSTGFMLDVYEFDHRPTDPARPMQAVRLNPNWVRDYGSWKMDADDRQIVGVPKGRYFNFEWGSNADRKMVDRIRKAFEFGTRPMSH